MHLVLAADDSRDDLRRELDAAFPGGFLELHPGLFACDAVEGAWSLPHLVFARQVVPDARALRAPSIRAWTDLVAQAVVGVLPDGEPWSLHVFPFKEVLGSTRMGARAWHTQARKGEAGPPPHDASVPKRAGQNRCLLVREALNDELRKRRRHLLRSLRQEPAAFGPTESLVQLMLVSPDEGYLSLAPAPVPLEQRHVLSCFPAGQVALAADKQAPSRAFAKLVEAESRMGRRIAAGQRCVDLGAAPGSWTYVAARRGARVTAIDRSPLRDDLLKSRNVRFETGDAFRFEPSEPVDWLLCDVIAAAERSAELLLRWLGKRLARHFVVTLKLDDAGSSDVLGRLERELPELTSEFWLMRLCANKKEVCAFGTAAGE